MIFFQFKASLNQASELVRKIKTANGKVRLMRNNQQSNTTHADHFNAGLAYLMAMLTLGYTAIHYVG